MKYGRSSYLVDVCVWSYHLNLLLCSQPFGILTVVCYKLLTPPDGSVSTPIRVHNTTNSAENTIVDIRAKMCCPRMWPLSPRRLKLFNCINTYVCHDLQSWFSWCGYATLSLIWFLKSFFFKYVTLDHKTSLKSVGYICSNSQKYIVWVKIIDFSFMPKIIRILSKGYVPWRNFVNVLP